MGVPLFGLVRLLSFLIYLLREKEILEQEREREREREKREKERERKTFFIVVYFTS